MSDLMEACQCCGRTKAVDGFPFCGGSYCLHELEEDREPDSDDSRWTADGNENERDAA